MTIAREQLEAVPVTADDSHEQQEPARQWGRRKRRVISQDAELVPLDYEQIPLSTLYVSQLGALIGGIPPGATTFLINVEGASLRYSDSTNPTVTYGELWQAGSSFSRTLADLSTVRLVGTAAGAIANVSYYAFRN